MGYQYVSAAECRADIAAYEDKLAYQIAKDAGDTADYIKWFYAAYEGEK